VTEVDDHQWQNEACFSYAEREHLRGVISELRRKGTAKKSFPQEGTFR
jgi:hypothetical protein